MAYTRLRYAAAVKSAHDAIHEAEESRDTEGVYAAIDRAHEALHAVYDPQDPPIDCATRDPEAQAAVAELVKMLAQPLPCGHTMKPVHPQWVRSLRDQCKDAGVAFCFLGFGAWSPDVTMRGACSYEDMALFSKFENGDVPIYLRDLEEHRRENWAYWHNADDVFMYCVGPERSGRMLDGREWLEVPEGI